jgi:TolB-like protein
MSLFRELKRRNVFRVAIAYVVTAWLVAQVLELLFDSFGTPDWVMKTIIVLMAVGLVFTLVFAWAFELTPEGIRRESEVNPDASIRTDTGKKLDRTIIIVLVLAVSYFAWESRFSEKGSEPFSEQRGAQDSSLGAEKRGLTPASPASDDQSIAVLPFVNMSPDADNEYFSDGISEELLNVLVKVNSLRVASRTSSFAYKGKDISIADIARQLQVDHILEGSVRKADNRVRITAQLIDGRSDRHLWSETYERELVDIFNIQEEISNAIVDALKVALNVDEQEAVSRAQHPTDNTQAYELYLQGRYRWRQRQEENILAAIKLFEQAVALDPGFAIAYEALAAAHGSLSSWSAVGPREALARASAYAERALELDPKLPEARAIIAEALGEQHRWQEMLEQYELAIRNSPNNPTVLQWQAEILQNLGYIDRALETVMRAYALDPASPVLNNVIINIAGADGQDELALKHWQIASDLGVAQRANANVSFLFLRRGEIDRVIELFGWVENEVPLCVQARKDPSLRPLVLRAHQSGDLEPANPRVRALCLAFVGDLDAAMDTLEPMAMQENWYAINFFWFPFTEIAQLRRSERFKQLAAKMGLVTFWREHGWPDLCRPLGEEDFECD